MKNYCQLDVSVPVKLASKHDPMWLPVTGSSSSFIIRVSIGSNYGLSPAQRQAIIWTNAGLLSIGPLGTKIQWNFCKNIKCFLHENAFEIIVCDMAGILSRRRRGRLHPFKPRSYMCMASQLGHHCVWKCPSTMSADICPLQTHGWLILQC